jgi:lipid-A-disaccharide synthase
VASAAHRARVPVLYYIAPQTWAWRPQRTRRLREAVDRLAVILPFEESFFEQAGLKADFVGHPLLDSEPPPSRSSARAAMGMSFQERVLAIFPGSREAELKRHWPLFRDAALRLLEQGRCDRVVVAATGGGDYPDPGPAMVYREGSRHVLAAADVALIKSGTATLEAALAGVPMAVAYAVSAVTNLVARRVMTVRWISLVNLVADRELVPEIWRDGVDAERLIAALVPLLDPDSAERRNQLNGFATVRARLGEPGAASRVAAIAAGMLPA